MACTLLLAVMFGLVNLIVDVIYAYVIRESKHSTRNRGWHRGKTTLELQTAKKRSQLAMIWHRLTKTNWL